MSASARSILQFMLLVAAGAVAASPYAEFIFIPAFALGWNTAKYYQENEF